MLHATINFTHFINRVGLLLISSETLLSYNVSCVFRTSRGLSKSASTN